MNQQNPNRIDPKQDKTKAAKKTNCWDLWPSSDPVTPICSEAKILHIDGLSQTQPRHAMTVGEILDLCSDIPAPGQYWKDTTSALPSLLKTRLVHYLNRIPARYRAFLILVLMQRAVAPLLEANVTGLKTNHPGKGALAGNRQQGKQTNHGSALVAALDAGEEWNAYAETHGLNTEQRALGFVALLLWDCGSFMQEQLEHINGEPGTCEDKSDEAEGQPHPRTLEVLTSVFARLTQPYQAIAQDVIRVLEGSGSEKHIRLKKGIRWSIERISRVKLGTVADVVDRQPLAQQVRKKSNAPVSFKPAHDQQEARPCTGETCSNGLTTKSTKGPDRAVGCCETGGRPKQKREMRKPRPSLEWAAGMLDGDGCISLARQTYRNRNSTLVLLITITQNCKETLEYFRDSVGIPATIYPTKRRAQHSKQVYVVNYTGSKAKALIERLDGLLFRKRLEAQLAIDFYEKGQVGRRFGPHGLPPAVKAFREACFQKMRALK